MRAAIIAAPAAEAAPARRVACAAMNWPYELQIGWRYTRAGRAGRRNGFISFISGVSMLGIALGVAALIIVLSVMNGFQKEVRDRMLSVIAHVEVYDAAAQALPDWQRHGGAGAARTREVIGAAPFIAAQALIARGDDMRGAIMRGISPAEEATVTDLAAQLQDTHAGAARARRLGHRARRRAGALARRARRATR